MASSLKMKRKDLEEVYNEFSDFSLSSPARKIRRLNAELPPIMEEDEPIAPPVFDSQFPQVYPQDNAESLSAAVIEEVPSFPTNEERALVLYKPLNTPPMQPPCMSNLSLKVNADLIPGLKGRGFWSEHHKIVDEENEKSDAIGNSLAVVPWVPSNVYHGAMEELKVKKISPEPMEAAEGPATMEVEENVNFVEGTGGRDFVSAGSTGIGGSIIEGQGQQLWPQQHCMIPNISPSNSSTPITWSW